MLVHVQLHIVTCWITIDYQGVNLSLSFTQLRNSRYQMNYKTGALKISAKLSRNLCQSSFFNKVASLFSKSSCEL